MELNLLTDYLNKDNGSTNLIATNWRYYGDFQTEIQITYRYPSSDETSYTNVDLFDLLAFVYSKIK